jgi:hypothetical protein
MLLLEEVIQSKILCKLVLRYGVPIDMLNETHNAKTLGSKEPEKQSKHIQGEQKIKIAALLDTTLDFPSFE